MPRKPVVYSDEHPYHVTARSNNKEWFEIPLNDCFDIHTHYLNESIKRFKINPHAFVLMNNHFHMLVTTPKANIGEFLRYFLTESSRHIRKQSGRINHIYGGRNHKSLILEPHYYAHCLKYVLRNPIRAGLSNKVESYAYSTAYQKPSKMKDLICEVSKDFSELLPSCRMERLHWLNQPTPTEIDELCRKALRRTEFHFRPGRRGQKRIDPMDTLSFPKNASHPQKVPGTF